MSTSVSVLFGLLVVMEVLSLLAVRNVLRFNATQLEINALMVQREAALHARVEALEGQCCGGGGHE